MSAPFPSITPAEMQRGIELGRARRASFPVRQSAYLNRKADLRYHLAFLARKKQQAAANLQGAMKRAG